MLTNIIKQELHPNQILLVRKQENNYNFNKRFIDTYKSKNNPEDKGYKLANIITNHYNNSLKSKPNSTNNSSKRKEGLVKNEGLILRAYLTHLFEQNEIEFQNAKDSVLGFSNPAYKNTALEHDALQESLKIAMNITDNYFFKRFRDNDEAITDYSKTLQNILETNSFRELDMMLTSHAFKKHPNRTYNKTTLH